MTCPNVRVVSNAHAKGGGELSAAWIAQQFASLGKVVHHHPVTTAIEYFYRNTPDVVKAKPFYRVHDPSCDVLAFYCNDAVYKLEAHRAKWQRAFKFARRKVLIVNFVIGESWQHWFCQNFDAVIFLNTDKRDEWLAKARPAFRGEVFVFPPPVQLDSFLSITPDYDAAPVLVRHGRVFRKYDEDFHAKAIPELFNRIPDLVMKFMAEPKFLREGWAAPFATRIKSYKWDEISPAEFLCGGNLFWYPLPKNLRDQGPRVIVEAMAAGIPCVAEGRDGAKNRITPDTGVLCSNSDMVSQICSLFGDRKKLRSKGEAAKVRARKSFDPDNWIKAIWPGVLHSR